MHERSLTNRIRKQKRKIMLNRTKLKYLNSELRQPEQEGLKRSVTVGKCQISRECEAPRRILIQWNLKEIAHDQAAPPAPRSHDSGASGAQRRSLAPTSCSRPCFAAARWPSLTQVPRRVGGGGLVGEREPGSTLRRGRVRTDDSVYR